MDYKSQLKDPRWQKRRLEVLQFDNFSCRRCKANHKELHVHHVHYEKNTPVWDYDNYHLVTFCNDCHKEWHESQARLMALIIINAFVCNLNEHDILKAIEIYVSTTPPSEYISNGYFKDFYNL